MNVLQGSGAGKDVPKTNPNALVTTGAIDQWHRQNVLNHFTAKLKEM